MMLRVLRRLLAFLWSPFRQTTTPAPKRGATRNTAEPVASQASGSATDDS